MLIIRQNNLKIYNGDNQTRKNFVKRRRLENLQRRIPLLGTSLVLLRGSEDQLSDRLNFRIAK
jgi:hypothetical protein